MELLHTKDEVFDAYTDFEVWAKTQFRVRSFKRFQTGHRGKYLSHKFNQHLATNESLPHMTLLRITEWLKGSTVYSWNAPRHFFIQAHFPNFSGEKQSNTPSG